MQLKVSVCQDTNQALHAKLADAAKHCEATKYRGVYGDLRRYAANSESALIREQESCGNESI